MNKANHIIDENIEISGLIKKNIEVNFMKRLLLSQNERYLFDHQFRYLNLGNTKETNIHLDNLKSLNEKRKFEDCVDM